jgi:hypothetical protein
VACYWEDECLQPPTGGCSSTADKFAIRLYPQELSTVTTTTATAVGVPTSCGTAIATTGDLPLHIVVCQKRPARANSSAIKVAPAVSAGQATGSSISRQQQPPPVVAKIVVAPVTTMAGTAGLPEGHYLPLLNRFVLIPIYSRSQITTAFSHCIVPSVVV